MSVRTVLLSIDSESDFDRFGDYKPGIWQATITKDQIKRDASFWGAMGGTWSDELPLTPEIVGSVKDQDHFYPELESIDDLPLVSTGFYFDYLTQIVYVKFTLHEPWYVNELLDHGISKRFIDHAGYDTETGMSIHTYIDGVACDPRLKSENFSYWRKADPMAENRMSFDNCNLSLINSDGALDGIRETSIGQSMKVYYSTLPDGEWPTTLSQFYQVFQGTVSKISFRGGDTVAITGADIRESFNEPVIVDEFTLAEYPEIDPDLIGRSKNLIIGQVYKAPCVNVSDADKNRDWSVNSVINGPAVLQNLYDGDPDYFTPLNPSQYTYDPSTGNVALNKDPSDELVADVLGSGIISPITGLDSFKAVDVVLSAISNFSGYPFVSDFWDVDSVTEVQGRSPDVGLFIDDSGLTVKELIDKVLSSANTRLYMTSLTDPQGTPRVKFTMRDLAFDSGEVMLRINPEDVLSLPIPWGFAEKEHMTSISVEYTPKIAEEFWNLYRDDSRVQEAYENTPIIKEYQYQTFCTDLPTIEALAAQRYALGVQAPYRLKGSLGVDLPFEILDYVRYHHRRNRKQILNDAIWQVTGLDAINRTFELALVKEDADKAIVRFNADTFGPKTMYNDGLYLNLEEISS